jgi:hypothetical protein
VDFFDADGGLDADVGSVWSEEALSMPLADWRSGLVQRSGPPQRTFLCTCGYTYIAKGANTAAVADIFAKSRWRHNHKWHPEELEKSRMDSGWLQAATPDVPEAERSWVCRICLAALPCMPQRPLKTSAIMHLSTHAELNLKQDEAERSAASWSTGGWSTVPAVACSDPAWQCPVCNECLPLGLTPRQIREARLVHWRTRHSELDRRAWSNVLQGYTTDADYEADGHDILHFRVPYSRWLQPDGKVHSVKNKVILMMSWCRTCCAHLTHNRKGKACGTFRTKLSWWRLLQKKFPATARRLTKELGVSAKVFAQKCSEDGAGCGRS